MRYNLAEPTVSQFRICFSMRKKKKRERESRNARRNRVRCNTVKSALDYTWKRLASPMLKAAFYGAPRPGYVSKDERA